MKNEDIKTLKLRKIGKCRVCGKQYFLEHQYGTIPKHGKCKGAEYSPDKSEYLIESLDQATQLSKLIAEDPGACLQGGRSHNLACGDGNDCDQERRKLAAALAKYFLEHNPH